MANKTAKAKTAAKPAKKAAPKKAAKKAAKPAKKTAAKKGGKLKAAFAKVADKTGKTLKILAAELRGVMNNVQKPKGDLTKSPKPPARKK